MLNRFRVGISIWIVGAGIFLGIWGRIQLAQAQSNPEEIEVLQIRSDFYMIAGAGGNIGVQTGPDGTILVDAGNLAASERVVAALRKLTDQPIRYIINTS